MNNDILLELSEVTKKYHSLNQALMGINLRIQKGFIIGLMGPNGCGKSTLLKIMSGISRPTSGEVLIQRKKPSVKTKEIIAYLSDQDFFYSWMTVEETIHFYSSFYADWDNRKANKLMRLFELNNGDKLSHLSKGMKARLKIVLVLARKASLVLLDEPLSGIDPLSKNKILSSIMNEFRLEEQTIILSTHDVWDAESLFDEIIFMKNGKVIVHENTEHLRRLYKGSIDELWEEL
ncbi:ABC transporter ATP-binding protein [Bacillus spongiae]|uniref:ABC transporter ATP-binding protein n=1 Tax=Bacillus spongiae TaxID=2683610 RepID=A0ABU8HCK1_9BACI